MLSRVHSTHALTLHTCAVVELRFVTERKKKNKKWSRIYTSGVSFESRSNKNDLETVTFRVHLFVSHVIFSRFLVINGITAFKTLQAYNEMVSGFIKNVEGLLISGNYMVIGKVRHSQKMNDPCVPLCRIIANREGTILSAHCRGCMAGLGECCSHVASFRPWQHN